MTAPRTTDLVTWLREQIAEDERVAHAAETRLNAWAPDLPPWESARYLGKFGSSFDHFVARHDPRSVLAQCEAHRAIVDLHLCAQSGNWERGPYDVCEVCVSDDYPCDTLRLLAVTYQHRPGYREEWRP